MSKRKRQIPQIVEKIKSHRRWFKVASKTIETVEITREGGPLSKILGGAVLISDIIDAIYPDEDPWSYFHNKGLASVDTPIAGFLLEIMAESNMPRALVAATLTDQALVFVSGDTRIGFVASAGKYSRGPYVVSGSFDDLVDTLRLLLWDSGHDLILSAKHNDYSYKGGGKYSLSEMQDPGPYLGARNNPESFAKRLKRYKDEPRTVLLRGPTGVGKSVFARHVAKAVAGRDSKTLKISSSALKNCEFDQLQSMLKLFRPTVLLLDDLSLGNVEKTEEFLALLEVLRDPDCLVVGTVMLDQEDDPNKKAELGDWYFPGIRPGRVDEVLSFFLPNDEERNLILRHYLGLELEVYIKDWDKILDKTRSLSGAYLGEVAKRLRVHGFDAWEEEIDSVIRTSPEAKTDDDEDESKEKNTTPGGAVSTVD